MSVSGLRYFREEDVPVEVYASFVASLYRDRNAIISGAVMQASMALCAWIETGHPAFGVVALLMAACGVVRYADTKDFERSGFDGTDVESVRYWENRFIRSASIGGFLLGCFGFLGIYWAPGAFATLGSSIVAFASIPTIVGRLYGSKRLVITMLAALAGPIILAGLLLGDVPHLLLALFFVPYLKLVLMITKNVREVLFEALSSRRAIADIAARFDIALNSMSHALIMFDGNRKVAVANSKACNIMRVPADSRIEGRPLAAIVRYMRMSGLLDQAMAERLNDLIARGFDSDRPVKVLIDLSDGRFLEFSVRKSSLGGAVLIFEDVTDRVIAERQASHLARFDALTQLPNRVHFRDQSATAIARAGPGTLCALVVFDVDDFKHVNDTMGHPVGDALLRAVSARVSQFQTEHIQLSRLGGDEFLALLTNLGNESEAGEFVNRLREALSAPYVLGDQQRQINFSFGYSVVSATEFDLDVQLVKADLALYEAKGRGKGLSMRFEESMDKRYQMRQRLKRDLEKAIADDALNVYYQPIVDARSLKLLACEALSRWEHPELGTISPAVYIPIAEENGLIGDISRSVLRKACRDCLGWGNGIAVSVNLSAVDFRTGDAVTMVREALVESGLDPSRLEIELTETAVITNGQETGEILLELKAAGVRIALDDFGTGYSSLSYLHRLPLDRVKIDRSFVEDICVKPQSLKLLSAVTQLAKDLGLGVTLEGVETAEQLELVAGTMPVDRIQGFLLGPALPALAIAEFAFRTRRPVRVQARPPISLAG